MLFLSIKYNYKCNHNKNVFLQKADYNVLRMYTKHFTWNLNFIENQPSASFKSDTFCTLGEEMGKTYHY